MTAKAGEHERQYKFTLARFERWALPRLARALPAWVMPDHMTILGLFAATGVGVSFYLTNFNPAWLWAASGFLILQWYGDSLDGTLARERKIERPRYGFYLDHLTDAYSTFIIGLGLGLSPYMLLSIALGIVIAYMVMSINVYLETHVYGEFSFGYGMMGPTEIRIVLIAINTAALIVGPFRFQFMGQPITVFDIVGLVIFLALFGLLTARATQNLRRLSRLEPPAGKARSLDSDGEASQ